MLGSFILETAIGLAALFLFVALVTTALQEFWSSLAHFRAKTLRRGLEAVLDDKYANNDICHDVLDHPIIYARTRSEAPPYIPSSALATALIDTLGRRGKTPPPQRTYASVRAAVDELESARLKQLLRIMFREGETDLAEVEKRLTPWFDDAMDRISGQYKKEARWRCLGISLVLAFVLQVDAVFFAGLLWEDAGARENVELAKTLKGLEPAKSASETPKAAEAPGAPVTTHFAKTTDVKTTTYPAAPVDASTNQNPTQPQPAPQGAAGAQPGAPEQPMMAHTNTVETIETVNPGSAPSVEKSAKTCLDPAGACLGPSQSLLTKLRGFNFDSAFHYVTHPCNHAGRWLSFLVGCLMTGLAAGFAAPLWFQILQKLMDFRAAGPSPKGEGGGGGETLFGGLRAGSAAWSAPIVAAAAAGGTVLAVTGTLALSPDATVKLDPASTVTLAQGTTVKLVSDTVKLASNAVSLDQASIDALKNGITLSWNTKDIPQMQLQPPPGGVPITVRLAGTDLSGILNKIDSDLRSLSPQITGGGGTNRGVR